MYFPKSQIKPNLYTNGGEYVIFSTKKNYKGYYFETSKGTKYTGKTPQDGPNQLIIPKPIFSSLESDEGEGVYGVFTPNPPIRLFSIPVPFTTVPIQERFLPLFNPTTPTQKDYDLGVYTRYFCKKTNEPKFLEVNKDTYQKLKSKDPKIAWDIYEPQLISWYLKGEKEKIYSTNKNLVLLLEEKQKWYGFSQYLKEEYLKYYLAS